MLSWGWMGSEGLRNQEEGKIKAETERTTGEETKDLDGVDAE